MDKADRALDKAWPARKGDDYVRQMNAVAEELKSIATAMKKSGEAKIEQSRAHRYLGSVYSDLAPALGKQMLVKAVGTYREAEALLQGGDALERAKLDFNMGNALRQLDPNDRDQLQEAERRFMAARRVFVDRSPQHVASVDEALSSTRGLLKVAPLAKAVARNKADLESLEAELAAGGDVAEIAKKMEELRGRAGGVTGMFAAIQGIVNELPDSAKQDGRYAKLMEQMSELASALKRGDRALDPRDANIMQLLRDKLKSEEESGRVTAGRAQTLSDLLDDFGKAMGSGGEDIQSLMTRVEDMRSKAEAQFANLHYLSHGVERPPEGSRAAQLVELCWSLRLFLLEEMNRSGKSEGDSKKALDFNVRAAGVDKRIYEAGGNDAFAIVVDKEALRPFASEVREFSARHHPLLARPIWSGARTQVDTNAVLFAGSSKTRELASKVCRQLGLELMSQPKGAAVASARWKQLQKANATIFDLSMRDGPARAAVAYELGIARTLGKPVLVLAKDDQEIPFDVDVDPVLLSGSAADIRVLAEAIDQALVWTMIRPRSSAVAATIENVLNKYSIPHEDTYANQTLKQLQRLSSDPDPVAVNAGLKSLVKYIGDDRLMLIHPVWPPVYPQPGKVRLFHVMPFRPKWADTAAKRVESACAAAGVVYVRGDRVSEPNVIRSIWEEINRATHVLVDMTGFNANVALELGIAHTLGRPTLMVGQGETVNRLFPMIAKLRFYPYAKATDSALSAQVSRFVASSAN
jgi:nucleoside 2-deoxyribosyltransferase